jgi:hypothetical protein
VSTLSHAELVTRNEFLHTQVNQLDDERDKLKFRIAQLEERLLHEKKAAAKMRAGLSTLELNPPAGSTANVGDFPSQAYDLFLRLIHAACPDALTKVGKGHKGRLIDEMSVEYMNNNIMQSGGILATLITPAVGGTLPRIQPPSPKAKVIVDKLLAKPNLAREVLFVLAQEVAK